MIGDDLQYVATVETKNLVLVAGYADGKIWFEYSNDDGETKYTFADDQQRRQICETSQQEQPALEVLTTGEIVCTVNTGSELTTYLTQDFGETWTRVDSIT